jgi:hypothetical protein
MDIAHSPSGVLRLIAKVVLLGFLVVLFAKAILALLGFAVVGLVACLAARTLYLHRAFLSRIVFRIQATLIRSTTGAFRFIATILGLAGWLFVCALLVILIVGRFAARTVKTGVRLLYALLAGALCACSAFCGLVGRVMQKSTLRSAKGLAAALLAILIYAGRAVAACVRAPLWAGVSLTKTVSAAGARIGNLSGLICGTLLEVASGALIGTILLNLKGVQGLLFLPEIDQLGPRIGAAALFGAFLGIALGLSRITRGKESESTVDPICEKVSGTV